MKIKNGIKQSWTKRNWIREKTDAVCCETSRFWRSVCYGDGKFITVARSSNVFAYSYDDEGNLSAIETDEEWEMVEEVLGAFSEENL